MFAAEGYHYWYLLWEAFGSINWCYNSIMSPQRCCSISWWRICGWWSRNWKHKAWNTLKYMWTAMLLCSAPSLQNKVIIWMPLVLSPWLNSCCVKNQFVGCSFCVYRCNFLLNNVIDKVLLLTRRREKYLVVAAVRFVRTILSRHVSDFILFIWYM